MYKSQIITIVVVLIAIAAGLYFTGIVKVGDSGVSFDSNAAKNVGNTVTEKAGEAAKAAQGDDFSKAAASFFSFDYDAALEGYRKAMDANPKHPEVPNAMYRIARCWEEKGKNKDAVTAYQAYLAKYPTGEMASEAKKKIEFLSSSSGTGKF